MKLLLLKENVKNVLHMVSGAVGSGSLPVLKNILIRSEENTVFVSATNLDLAVTCILPAKISDPGAVTVPFQSFFTIVNNLSSEKITFSSKKSVIDVVTDNYNASLQTISEDEFPIIPRIENMRNSIIIEGKIFKKALDQVVHAAAKNEDFRPELSGVLFSYEGSAIKIAATDSFRLAEKTISGSEYKSSFEKGFSVIIPVKNVVEMIKIMPDDTVSIYFDDNQVVIKSDSCEIVSRLVEGKFPDYKAIIPKEFTTKITADGADLLEGLRLANIFSGKLRDATLRVMDNKKAVELFSKDTGVGENTYVLPAKIEGEAGEGAVFNIGYIADGLRGIGKDTKNEKIFIGLNHEKKPSLFRSPDDASYFYILMPIKQ